ncbi:hypothetical protein L1987_25030 [Smallanthus sonchifolius]|uniref:Uncharacterized protein n=1 Tax=Smallanthus sonchifolius TaxID=185202 RepID=A0ACB9ILF1_9ASTR|nr:hypothetical protein L1987_25030 [Smallanthus sonchifolius]
MLFIDRLLVIGANEDNAPSKICKATRPVEYSSSNSNTSRTGAADSALSTAPVLTCHPNDKINIGGQTATGTDFLSAFYDRLKEGCTLRRACA